MLCADHIMLDTVFHQILDNQRRNGIKARDHINCIVEVQLLVEPYLLQKNIGLHKFKLLFKGYKGFVFYFQHIAINARKFLHKQFRLIRIYMDERRQGIQAIEKKMGVYLVFQAFKLQAGFCFL